LGGEHLSKYNETVRLIGEAYNSASPKVKNFEEVQKTLNFQLKQLTAAGGVLAINLGTWLLPKVSAVANWANGVISYFQQHPLIANLASDAAIAAFGTALSIKLAGVGVAIAKAFGINAILSAPEIGAAIAAFVITGFSLKDLIVDPVKRALNNLNNFFTGGGGTPNTTTNTPTTNTTTKPKKPNMVDVMGYKITQGQYDVLKTKYRDNNWDAIAKYFAAQDQKGNYQVTVYVK